MEKKIKGIQRTYTQMQALPPLKVGVSPTGYDNMGAVLQKLNHTYIPIGSDLPPETLQALQIVFLNCSSGQPAPDTLQRLETFVSQGGVALASDWAARYLTFANIPFVSVPQSQNVQARFVDLELVTLMGGTQVPIHFDLGGWFLAPQLPAGTHVFFRGTIPGYGDVPLAWKLKYGRGFIIYTAFHNHVQTSEVESQLLKLLALSPVAAATGKTLIQTALNSNWKE